MALDVKILNFFSDNLTGKDSLGWTIFAGVCAYGIIKLVDSDKPMPFKIAMVQSVATAVLSSYLIIPRAVFWSTSNNGLKWSGWTIGQPIALALIVALPILMMRGYDKYLADKVANISVLNYFLPEKLDDEEKYSFKKITFLTVLTAGTQIPFYLMRVGEQLAKNKT